MGNFGFVSSSVQSCVRLRPDLEGTGRQEPTCILDTIAYVIYSSPGHEGDMG